MSDADRQPSAFRLGTFVVEPQRNRLVRDGREYTLEPRVMDVLRVLAENGDGVTTRQALIERLWPSQYGADAGLSSAVSSLRRVIREAGEADAYIETIPKRGYRLLKTAEAIGDTASGADAGAVDGVTAVPADSGEPRADTDEMPGAQPPTPLTRRGPRSPIAAPWALLLLAGLILAVAAAMGILGRSDGDRTSTEVDASETAEAQGTDAARGDFDPSAAATPIAVLPFRPLTDDPADRYFGDGIAEELQQLLARVTSLRVMARTSSFSVDRDDASVGEVGEQLAVDYVVSGSVRRAGDRCCARPTAPSCGPRPTIASCATCLRCRTRLP